MKPRLHYLQKEIICVSLCFLLIMLMPHARLKLITIPAVQAQGWEPTLTMSDVQFNGSSYFYDVGMSVGYYSFSWQLMLSNNIDYIVTDVVETGMSVDASAFYEEPGGCIGFGDCAINCNACTARQVQWCKNKAYGEAIAIGSGIGLSCMKCVSATAVSGIGTLACVIVCAAALGISAAAIHSGYDLCKAGVASSCSNELAPCVCKLGG